MGKKSYNPKYEKILTIMMYEDIITEAQLNEALEIQQNITSGRKKKIGEILMDLEYADFDDIIFALSLQLGFPKATEEQILSANENIVHLIPEDFAEENEVIAFEKNQNELKIAMKDPDVDDIIDQIEKMTGITPTAFVAHKSIIEKAVEKYY